MQERSFAVTAITKFAHAKLLGLAREHGGIPAFARELGISEATLRAWVYLRTMPACGKRDCRGRKVRSRFRTAEAVRRLCELAEASPEELFPGFIRERLDGRSRITETTRAVSLEQLDSVSHQQLTYEVNIDERLDSQEMVSRLLASSGLTCREREIVNLRFGLGDGRDHTRKEVGHIFKVTTQRICEIEAKAMRKLQRQAMREG